MRLKRRNFFVFALVAILNAAPAARAATLTDIVTSVDVLPGDEWVYRDLEDVQHSGEALTEIYSVVSVGSDRIDAIMTTDAGWLTKSTRPIIYNRSWSVEATARFVNSSPNTTFGIVLPLRVGSRWNSRYDVQAKSFSAISHGTSQSVVTNAERVTLPTGQTFDTFRISSLSNEKSADGRTETATRATVWYCPEVNRYVQRIVEIRVNGAVTARRTQYLLTYSHQPTS
ncbi:MAG: hypothetical protein ABW275_07845 [Hansschlegelia sp.]